MKRKSSDGWMVAVIILLINSVTPAFGQGRFESGVPIIFKWSENQGGPTGAVLQTPDGTTSSVITTAVAPVTAYETVFYMENRSLTIQRNMLDPFAPDASTYYSAGPVQIQPGGKSVIFSAWLNPSASLDSSEGIFDVEINGRAIALTVLADWDHKISSAQYDSPVSILQIKFKQEIHAVNYADESGIGVNVLSQVPEPGTASIIGLGLLFFLVRRNKKSS